MCNQVGPRASKRDRAEGAMSTFKGVTGVLTPHCWCLDHSMPKDKRIFEITDVDPATNLVGYHVLRTKTCDSS